jgi:putative membrane protein
MNRNRKLSRVGKTIVSGLVVTSLVLGNGSMIQAEKVTKEESVYVNADADGDAEKITVSDWLKNAGINGTLKDKSELKDITNVKGDETFEQSGDGVSWNAGAQDIYYQGTTDKELPVGVKLVYELDGKEISPEELPGKSGALKSECPIQTGPE